MKKLFLLTALFGCVMVIPAQAQENWTEVGLYAFMTAIEGDATIGGAAGGEVTTDVDVSFDDILDNLDIGFMGFAEHRRGKWSFIGDVAYLKLSAEKTTSRTPLTSTTLDAEFAQTLVGVVAGYRVFAQDRGEAQLGIDLLGGARYNKLAVELDVTVALPGGPIAAERSPEEDWVDGVIGARFQYGHDNGWGVSALVDIGEGSDSSSFQLIGIVNYRFKNNIRVLGGYRFLNLENTVVGEGGRRFDIDLDYTGPVLGATYRF